MLKSNGGRSSLSNEETIFGDFSELNCKETSSRFVVFESLFSAARSLLERKTGQPHLINSAQLDRTQSYPTKNYQDFKCLWSLRILFQSLLVLFTILGTGMTYSLEMVTGKLPLDMRREWFRNNEKHQNRAKPPSLMDLHPLLREQANVYGQLLSSMKTSRYDPFESNGDSSKKDPKDRRINFAAVVSDKRSTN